MGLEMTKFSAFPLRIGFAWGGADFQELGLGFGIHKGPIIFDFGFAFRNGIWIHSMKGINISTQLTLTGFRGRESKKKAGDNGPAPVPDEMDTEGAEESAEEGVEEGAEETVEESLPDTEEQK